jgi:hypothetical protein
MLQVPIVVPGPPRRRLELRRVQSTPPVLNQVRFPAVQPHVLVPNMLRHDPRPHYPDSASGVVTTRSGAWSKYSIKPI